MCLVINPYVTWSIAGVNNHINNKKKVRLAFHLKWKKKALKKKKKKKG